jgi:phosphoribosylformylglycinamidine synthase
MKTVWSDAAGEHRVLAPVSLIVSAFAPVRDVRRSLTPLLDASQPTRLLLVDLGGGRNRLGGSCWAQVHGRQGGAPADLEDPGLLQALFAAVTELKDADLALAYHDRSDGGVLITLLEMAFAGHAGLDVDLGPADDAVAACFAEEPGCVLQVPAARLEAALQIFARHGLGAAVRDIGAAVPGAHIEVRVAGAAVLRASRVALHRTWSEVSHALQARRDHPACAQEEHERLLDAADPGLHAALSFDPAEDVAAPFVRRGARPAVAVLREQGVNSQTEMAAVFTRAGFDAYDVHMTDLIGGRLRLARFHGLVACGGFSYGDVLGAGEGWAKSILFNAAARDEFSAFFDRPQTFALGVCNGCQMLTALKELVPGAAAWPRFVRNRSEQYEARLSLVRVPQSRSVLLTGMQGSVLPIVVAHGEGRATFAPQGDAGVPRGDPGSAASTLLADGLLSLQFLDHHDRPTELYPFNPNGSPQGLAGVCNEDGRVTAIMPHPERVFRTVQYSWAPPGWPEDGGWMRLFRNARAYLG